MRKIVSILGFLLGPLLTLQGQELLTAKEAVAIALENNFSVRLVQNELAVATENVHYGNAGMLPSLTANLTQNNNVQNSTQVQNNGEKRSLKNAKNNNLNYGVSLGWTVFDGLGMFARYERLQELQNMGDVNLKRTMLATIADVITLYYTIVEQRNNLDALDSTIVLSQERLRTAENRYSIGKASKLEVLNVQVNLNTDISTRLRQIELVKNLKTNLNSLLVRDLDASFSVEKEVAIDSELQYAELLERASQLNPDLQMILINKRIAELDLKQVKANRYPTVRLNTGYNFSRSESSLGFVASSNARGLNYGVTASLNVFDGFNQRRNERVAQLQIDHAALQIDQLQLQVKTGIKTAHETYQTNLALTKLEEKNADIAKQNLDITLAKYTIGSISAVEFRDAQENYIQAVSRYNSAMLQAKLAEIQLKELVGQIIL